VNRSFTALAAATAVDRASQAALARSVLAQLALAQGDRTSALALLEPVGVALGHRLGLSERARRAAAKVYAALDLPVPCEAAGTAFPFPEQS